MAREGALLLLDSHFRALPLLSHAFRGCSLPCPIVERRVPSLRCRLVSAHANHLKASPLHCGSMPFVPRLAPPSPFPASRFRGRSLMGGSKLCYSKALLFHASPCRSFSLNIVTLPCHCTSRRICAAPFRIRSSEVASPQFQSGSARVVSCRLAAMPLRILSCPIQAPPFRGHAHRLASIRCLIAYVHVGSPQRHIKSILLCSSPLRSLSLPCVAMPFLASPVQFALPLLATLPMRVAAYRSHANSDQYHFSRYLTVLLTAYPFPVGSLCLGAPPYLSMPNQSNASPFSSFSSH